MGLLIGLTEMALLLVVPLVMLAYAIYLRRTWHDGVTPQARELSVAMIVSHFAGLAVLVSSFITPSRLDLEPHRLLVVGLGITLVGVVPACICAVLAIRRLLPQRLRPYSWMLSAATSLLSVTLGFAIWAADLAMKINARMH